MNNKPRSLKAYVMKKIVLLTLFIPLNLIAHPSHITKLYTKIFGNAAVKQEYTDLVQQALEQFGIENPESVPIKQMNNIGPMFALMPLSSFTAFGIWLDETYLDTCSPEERTFQMYHEAAHYAKKHHQKLLSSITGASITLASLLYLNKKLCINKQINGPIISIFGIVSIGALISSIVKRQEKEADLEAAKKLILLNKAHIVVTHIKNLNKTKAKHYLWFFSDKKQKHYLEPLLKNFNNNETFHKRCY